MPERHAISRPRTGLHRLPAILVAGIFLVVTAGAPVVAATTAPAVDGPAHDATVSTLSDGDLSAPAAPVTSPGHGPAALPPTCTGTVVDPADLFPLRAETIDHGAAPQAAEADRSHPDRAPPGTR